MRSFGTENELKAYQVTWYRRESDYQDIEHVLDNLKKKTERLF